MKVVAHAILKLAETAGLAIAREKRIGDLIERVSQISLKGYGLSLREPEGPEPFTSLTELLVDRLLPISVYLTGPPNFADMNSARRGATFARRFATTTLERFGDPDLEAALQPFVLSGWAVPDDQGGTRLVTMEPDARVEILHL